MHCIATTSPFSHCLTSQQRLTRLTMPLCCAASRQRTALPELHRAGSRHTFMRGRFLSDTEEPVQLHRYCCVEYDKDRSLGRYCFFCTRQTSLDSNCIPTSTRTTLRLVVSVLLPRPHTTNSASQPVSTVCLSGYKRTACSWTLLKLNSCAWCAPLLHKWARPRHFTSALTLCNR